MTVVELSITMGILALVTTAILAMLVAGKRSYLAGIGRARTMQDLQSASWQMAEELRLTSSDFITDGDTSNPPCISFPSAQDRTGRFITDESGGLVWQKFVVYYLPSSGRLLRKEVYSIVEGALPQLTLAETIAACDGKGELLASPISSFNLAVDAATGNCRLSLTSQNVTRAITAAPEN